MKTHLTYPKGKYPRVLDYHGQSPPQYPDIDEETGEMESGVCERGNFNQRQAQMKDPYEIINNLSPDDALFILKSLASDDLSLATRMAEMAIAHLTEVDLEAIAAELYDALEALKVEEVWDRAGKTRNGYVETGEAADEMIEEVLEPFLDEMKKYQKMGLTLEARHMCMGILLGLYDFEHACTSEFKEWSPDSPIAFAGEVVDAWRTVQPDKADVQALTAFIEDELNGWGPNVDFGS